MTIVLPKHAMDSLGKLVVKYFVQYFLESHQRTMTHPPEVQMHVWLPHIKWIVSVGSNRLLSLWDQKRGIAVDERERNNFVEKYSSKQLKKSGMDYLKKYVCPKSRILGEIGVLPIEYLRIFGLVLIGIKHQP